MEALRKTDQVDANLAGFYAHYLIRMLQGDLGYSRTLQAPVRQLLAERLPETLKSVALGLMFGWVLGLTLAAAPIIMRSHSVDLLGSLLAGVALAVPAAVFACMFVLVRAPGRLVVGLIVFPKVFRYARNLLAESASRPHVLTGWAKGIGSFGIFTRHILPGSAPQLVALAGVSISLAFAAAIPVEVVCDLPGIGQLAWKAAMGRDFELLVNLTMVVTAITLVANSTSGLIAQSLSVREV